MAFTYWQKLKDPRWQKMRLRAMERDGFACKWCGSTTATLNVHHGYYPRGAEPWDVSLDTLHTLCETCHEKAQSDLDDAKELIAYLSPQDVQELTNLIRQIYYTELPENCVGVMKMLSRGLRDFRLQGV